MSDDRLARIDETLAEILTRLVSLAGFDEPLDLQEAAEFCRISPASLKNANATGRGPQRCFATSRPTYLRSHLLEWLRSRAESPAEVPKIQRHRARRRSA